MTNTISFPGLGIGEFNINEVAFTVLGRDVAWYGVILTLGIIAAFMYVMFRTSKIEQIKQDDVLDYAIYCIISAVICSRLYYVLTSLDEFDSLYDAVAIWNGGLAIYGAVIGGGLAAVIVSLIKKIDILKVLDMLSPAVILGQSIGRWGNFVNAEAHGGECTWFCRMGIGTNGVIFQYVHPTFLYESIWNIIGFIILHCLYKKKKFDGEIFFLYIAYYGFGRMFIEGLRTDSLYVGTFRISQVIGLLSFVIGVLCIVLMSLKVINKNRYDKKSEEIEDGENN